MGLDVYSKLVVGLPGSRAFREETVTTKVQKFDEDNGAPYMKTIPSQEVVLFGVRFKKDEFLPMEGSLERFNEQIGSKKIEMEFHCYNSDGYDDHARGFFGFEIASLGGRCNEKDTVQIFEAKIHEYKEAFKRATGFDAEVHLMIHYSY